MRFEIDFIYLIHERPNSRAGHITPDRHPFPTNVDINSTEVAANSDNGCLLRKLKYSSLNVYPAYKPSSEGCVDAIPGAARY